MTSPNAHLSVVKTSSITQYRYLQMPNSAQHMAWPISKVSRLWDYYFFPSKFPPCWFLKISSLYQMLGSGKVHLCSPSPLPALSLPLKCRQLGGRDQKGCFLQLDAAIRKGEGPSRDLNLSPNSQIRKLQSCPGWGGVREVKGKIPLFMS